MAEIQMLGLFYEATPTADALEQLQKLGVPDGKITVMSGMPYRSEMFGRPRERANIGRFVLAGALLGLVLGLFNPLHVGGQPLIPLPPSLIILFETTMIGTMWSTFFGLIIQNRFPHFTPRIYDPRITEGHIGIAVELDEAFADQAASIFKTNGAQHLQRAGAADHDPSRFRKFWLAVGATLIVLTALILLPLFDVVKINIPTNMADQDSIGYEQGPRLAAPANAVPVQGPVLIAGQPASEPIPASANSLQRGKVMYDIDCALCHGLDGRGNGPLADYFSPRPADLHSSTVRSLPDTDVFILITQGRGPMPSLAENLLPGERWDVINYLRSLK